MTKITPVTIQTAAQEKKVLEAEKFQADLDNLALTLNTIISTLENMNSAESGAEYIQSRPVGTLNASTGGSVFTLLNAMYEYIGALQAGTIADASIGPEKLSFDPVTEAELAVALAAIDFTVNGGASSIIDNNLTASKILVSDANGKVSVSTVAASILGYLLTLTGDVQTQINLKQALIIGAASTILSANLAISRVLVSNSSGKVAASSISSTELGYLSGLASNLQTQLNAINTSLSGKLGYSQTAANSDALGGIAPTGYVKTSKIATGTGTSSSTAGGDTNITFDKVFASVPVVCCNSTGVNSYTCRIKSVSTSGFVLVISGASVGFNYIACED